MKKLEELSEQLGRWRAANRKRARLPEEFWQEAVAIAQREGLHRTAKRLPVDWRVLKKRLEQATPRFTEVTMPTATRPSAGSCVLERETSQGKIRLELSGLGVSEIAALVRELGG